MKQVITFMVIRRILWSLKKKVQRNVSFGDSSKVKIQGKDTILISLNDTPKINQECLLCS